MTPNPSCRTPARIVFLMMALALCSAVKVTPALSQDTTLVFLADSGPPQDSAAMMLGMMDDVMGPMMGRMAQAMLDGMLTVLSQPESAERLATFTRNYYEALVRRGFTAEQALRLTAAVGFPAIPGGGGG